MHEPDTYLGISRRTWRAIKAFGLYHMIIGRVLGRTGIRNLCQGYQAGRFPLKELGEAVWRQRAGYYASVPQGLIVESYYQWYGILPILPRLFQSYKVLGVTRDPRDWVTSWLNYERHFGNRDRVTRLGFRRLDPGMVGDKQYADKWKEMSPFQKLCWTWSWVYDCIHDFTGKDPYSMLVRYEDLFLSDEREKHFLDMLDFLTDFGDRRFTYTFRPELLGKRVNAAGRKLFADWGQWDAEHARQLQEICGARMARFGYGNEPEWREKLHRT